MSNIADIITNKVKSAVQLSHFELINESHMHSGPALNSHFKLIAVSDDYSSISTVKRHQSIYKLLKSELEGEVHALALHLYDNEEWQKKASGAPNSPNCQGASK